jgi:hypothetical protein
MLFFSGSLSEHYFCPRVEKHKLGMLKTIYKAHFKLPVPNAAGMQGIITNNCSEYSAVRLQITQQFGSILIITFSFIKYMILLYAFEWITDLSVKIIFDNFTVKIIKI